MLLKQLSPGCPPPSFPLSVLAPMAQISPHFFQRKPRCSRGRPGESCASCGEGESWKRWEWHPATPHPQFQTPEIACM